MTMPTEGFTAAGSTLVSLGFDQPDPSGIIVVTRIPERTADHAAELVWLTERSPRVAFGCSAVVNKSMNFQSLVGWVANVRPGPPSVTSQRSGASDEMG